MINFKEFLLEHYKSYPLAEIEDIFKFIYQGAFGCEHMIAKPDGVTKLIEREYSEKVPHKPDVEGLSEDYYRVSLSYLDKGLEASTLGKLLYLSSKKEKKGREWLEKALCKVEELIKNGELDFSLEEFTYKAERWKTDGYPALHHSNKFRSEYKPHYRVIWGEYIPLLPLLAKIDTLLKQGNVTVAVDGGSASGKTTLAALLCEIYTSSVFHMDDFFLTPHMRTRERLNEAGGNVDRERFEREVLIPLSRGSDVTYRKYDCSTGAFSEPVTVSPKKLVIVEGAYSTHPSLFGYYTLSVFLNIGSEKQRERILKRNSPALAKRFFEEWIPLENIYFEKTAVRNRCDLIIDI